MTDPMKQNKTAALVHWTYSREEWRNFMRWRKMKKGIFQYILLRLWPNGKAAIPQITITRREVGIDNMYEPFHNEERHLKRINIRDAGKINIMEITYEKMNSKHPGFTDIFIPVPKGKLREAIELQEKITLGV
jgi:hypothetical protein